MGFSSISLSLALLTRRSEGKNYISLVVLVSFCPKKVYFIVLTNACQGVETFLAVLERISIDLNSSLRTD